MKILHVTSGLNRIEDGVRASIYELSLAQKQIGHDVLVLGKAISDEYSVRTLWEGVEVEMYAASWPRSLGFSRNLSKRIEEICPDIVHLHGLWMPHNISVLKWHMNTGGRYVISVHGMLSDFALSYSRYKKKIAFMTFQKSVISKASKILVTSDLEKKAVEKFGFPTEVHVVPNGVRSTRADPVYHETLPEKYILSLGRLHRIKGLEHLIRAWALISEKFPDWSIKIVGPDNGGEKERLNGLIRELKLSRIEIFPPVFGAEKDQLISLASLFVVPSQSENFALTVVESLAAGVPVVASDGTPWAKLDEIGCGTWVPFGTLGTKRGLENLMALSNEERIAMGVRGREWMKREFSWSSVAKRLESVYSGVSGVPQ